MTDDSHGPWIQTIDGQAFDLLAPNPTQIYISTIATVLSRLCRFGGHCRAFYSVAEHSLGVCNVVGMTTDDPAVLFAALLHDAHEAYNGFGDVCRPAKELAPEIDEVNELIDAAIAEAMGFDCRLFELGVIKHADETMLATEARDLMGARPRPWVELPPPLPTTIYPAGTGGIACVEEVFLARARELLRAVRIYAHNQEQA